MDSFFVLSVINFLSSYPSEILCLVQFLTGATMLLLMFKFAGLGGIYVYSSISTILANIQALKLADFHLFNYPIALGTTTFATIYICDDIITEHYGKKAAKSNVWLCFLSQILVSCIMIETISFKTEANFVESKAIETIFLPSVRILIASTISFVVGQYLNINIFSKLLDMHKNNKLWLRIFIAFIISSFVDNVIFSSLAWVLFAPEPVNLTVLFFSYILPSYLLLLVFSLFSMPIVYISLIINPKKYD